MEFSRRVFASVVGSVLLGTLAGGPAAHAELPKDPGHKHHKGKGKSGNLLKNPSFELDVAGMTITDWTVS